MPAKHYGDYDACTIPCAIEPVGFCESVSIRGIRVVQYAESLSMLG